MKGKQQSSPIPQRGSPRKAAAAAAVAAQEKAPTSSTANIQRQSVAASAAGSDTKKPPKTRKLVYRYGQNQQPTTVSSTPASSSVTVLEAAQAILKQNLSKAPRVTFSTSSSNSPSVTVKDLSNIESGDGNETTVSGSVTAGENEKKIIKPVPGQTYIQEVRTESGDFLNFRCKLCKVRFTDLKEIHMRGRRHRLNLANAEKKTNPPNSIEKKPNLPKSSEKKTIPSNSTATTTAADAKPSSTKKKSAAEGKVVKKALPAVRKPPAILENLNQIRSSNIAEVLRKEKKKENFTIYKLYKEMQDSCVISERWCIPEPLWDPHTNREVLLCYEVDVLMDGSVRMKRCLKVLDNFELIVLLDGVDKTHIFREKHPTIQSLQEMLDLIRKVTMVKVCSGIKDCDPSEFDTITTKVIEKGGSWYSTECNVEVERGCLGNICKKCTSLRNTLRRRMRRQYGLDSTSSTPSTTRSLLSNSMKPVLRTVGEALYLNLHHMSGVNRASVSSEDAPVPPRSEEQVLHPDLQIYMNSDLKERLDEVAANPPPPLTKIEHIVEFDPRTMTKTLKRIHTPIAPSTLRSSLTSLGAGGRALGIGAAKRIKTDMMSSNNQSFVLGNNGELTLIQTPNGETIQLPEGYVLADDNQQWGDGNIVIQKVGEGQDEQFIVDDDNSIIQVGNLSGGNFTLQDGEEYEVIGEAPSGTGVDGDAIQVLPLGSNSEIEIIEVDENMIQLVDENSQPEIQPVDSNSDIFKFIQAHSRLQGL